MSAPAGPWDQQSLTVRILFLGAKLVIENQLTVGEFVAFNMITAQLSAPVLRLPQLRQDFQQVRLSIGRLGDILNATPEPGQRGPGLYRAADQHSRWTGRRRAAAHPQGPLRSIAC